MNSCFNAANELAELSSCPDVDAFGNPLIDPVIKANNHESPEGSHLVTIMAIMSGPTQQYLFKF